ncbi:MAG: serine hydroxymethyltransferase [Burkholderiales bacterium]|nr:serine hydroxymethyltransferase [Burkholderiales bacterium]
MDRRNITDRALLRALDKELQRQEDHIELIASENYASAQVMAIQGSVLTNKYAEGYPGRRYYGGCEYVDQAEQLAIDRVKKIFGAPFANVQPHSGAQANQAAYAAIAKPGDTILGMALAHGGHLTHGASVNFSGKLYRAISYGLDPDSERIDYAAVERLAREHRPQVIVAGASAYARIIDWARFRRIADDVGAKLFADMAHFAGLVAAGLYPSPVNVAHVTTSTTHKTLRGPRGGFILAGEELAQPINSAVFPGLQGGPLMHVIAAKAAAFHEAMTPAFKRYQKQVLANARALAEVLAARGCRIVSGGTDCHMFLLDLRPKGLTGKDAESMLGKVGITVNKNAIPNDPEKPAVTSGIRLGSPAMTTRGFGLDETRSVGYLIADLLDRPDDRRVASAVAEEVRKLCRRHPVYGAKRTR